MYIEEFDYFLPKKLIAQEPVNPRSSSKLIVEKNNLITSFNDLPSFLNQNDFLIFNDTKVISAVIYGKVNDKDIKVTIHTKDQQMNWIAFCKPAKNVNIGDVIFFNHGLEALVKNKLDVNVSIKFNFPEKKLLNYLNLYGAIPIPPYIKKKNSEAENRNKYQTVFAKNLGAFAAPTASLHFDHELFEKLRKLNIDIVNTTLHVGAGTFLPLKNSVIEKNILHREHGVISKDASKKINEAIIKGKNIVAVGTTVLRLLEACYRRYGEIKKYNEFTDLFIFPGFEFKVVNKLITNFHLPKSSLFILVCAFSGKKNVIKLYKKAIKNKLRFFSYGDAMLLDRNEF